MPRYLIKLDTGRIDQLASEANVLLQYEEINYFQGWYAYNVGQNVNSITHDACLGATTCRSPSPQFRRKAGA